MKKIVRKIFLPTMIGATLLSSLTGCGKENKEVKTTEEITTEVTTEPYVSEDTKLAITDEEYQEITTKEEIVEKTYNEYKKFYDYASVTKEEVKVMVDVINGDVEGYSEDQIKDSLALVRYALLSDNTSQLLDNSNAVKMGESIEEEFEVILSPKVSELLLDQENIDNIIAYENLRDELINEHIQTGTYSEEMAKKIIKATIEQEVNEYDSYKGNMDSSLNNEGTEYALTATKLSLCKLAQMVNPTSSFIKDEEGNEYQLNERSDVNEQGYIETDVLNQIHKIEVKGGEVPEDLIIKRAEIDSKVIYVKYYNGLCTLEDQLLTKAGYTKTSSMIDLQKQKKELLELKKLENVLAKNEMFEGYNLAFKM